MQWERYSGCFLQFTNQNYLNYISFIVNYYCDSTKMFHTKIMLGSKKKGQYEFDYL